MYKHLVRPLLFLFPPDLVHWAVVKFSNLIFQLNYFDKVISRFFVYRHPLLEKELLGVKFNNPIGLGGGFDKDCELTHVMPSLGFGFMDVGSITAKAYKGNPRPWNVRLPEDKGIIVNYGLKNKGADHAIRNLKKHKRKIPIIVNIAKTNDQNIHGEASIEDYLETFIKVEPHADWVTINISCPNSGDGVLFCEDMYLLSKLLAALQAEYCKSHFKRPILLKLKPDLKDEQLTKLLNLTDKYDCIKGFVVANLTHNRSNLPNTKPQLIDRYNGGISGRAVEYLANEMIKKIRKQTGHKYIIIGLGGVFNAEEAYEKFQAGADLIQLVTGLIYEGPGIAKNICQGLVKIWQNDALKN